MPYYKFKSADIFHNRIKTHPKKEFFVYDSKIYLDNQSQISGAFTGSVPNVPPEHLNLYELNVDRTASVTGRSIVAAATDAGSVTDTGLIYPFIVKNGNLSTFRTLTTASYNSDFEYGDIVSGSYPLSASITRQLFNDSLTRASTANHIVSLRNTLDYYSYISRHYQYSSSLGDKAIQAINLISIPSIFYASSIEKGTVNLKYYITGTLVGELEDENQNGELIQVGPEGSNGSGNVAGVVLYDEGFALLTGSWKLYPREWGDTVSLDYRNDGTPVTSSWLFYGVGANDGVPADAGTGYDVRTSASYALDFNGTNYVPVTTMLADAPRGQLNYSSNPTYIERDGRGAFAFNSSSIGYQENDKQVIKNTVKSPYVDPTGSYQPQTYISKIGVYDKNKNLIAIAKVATPVKKTENREYTFKMKLDF
jgi:hypothetical protein